VAVGLLIVLHWYLDDHLEKTPGLHPLTKWVLGIAGALVVAWAVLYVIAIQVSP
jgi:hypothetical protein